MWLKFWEKIGEELGSRWATQRLGLPLAFWGGGLLAWMWHSGWDWEKLETRLAALEAPAAYLAVVVGGLLILAASSTLVTWLQLPTLRLLEGYWPSFPRFGWINRQKKKLSKLEARWEALSEIDPARLTAKEKADFVRLDAKLSRYPVDSRNLMPTALGNLLRSAEEYPLVRYGLETTVCWPRLWLLLPSETQETLTQARQSLNDAARLFTWGALFALWTLWAWWALPIALGTMAVAYWAALQAAGVYGDLLRAAFDLHRFALYEQLRLPLPQNPETEAVHGLRLSEYLFRGTGCEGWAFTHPKPQ